MEENLNVDDVPISITSEETASDRALTLGLKIVICAVGRQKLRSIADDIDVVWRPENRLYIFSDSKFTLNSEEINCAGDKIRVHQLRSKSPCPE